MQPCLVQRRCHDAHEGRTASAEEMPHSKKKRKGIDFLVCLPGQSVVLCELLLVCTMKEELCCVFCLVAMHSRQEYCCRRRHRCPGVSTLPAAEQQSAGEQSSYVCSALVRLTRLAVVALQGTQRFFLGLEDLEKCCLCCRWPKRKFSPQNTVCKIFRRTLLTLLAFETASCADRNGFGVRFAQLSF